LAQGSRKPFRKRTYSIHILPIRGHIVPFQMAARVAVLTSAIWLGANALGAPPRNSAELETTEKKITPFGGDVLANSENFKAIHGYYSHIGEAKPEGQHGKHGKHHQTDDEVKNASTSFFMQAGLLVGTIFGAIFLYSKNTETVERLTGLKLTHLCCMVYATLSISIDLSIKNAAEAYGGHFPFNPACGVVVVEFLKCIVSMVLFAQYYLATRSSGGEIAWPRPQDVCWLGVPAAIYAMNNLLVFQAIKSTPLSTFGVIRETMLIWNAGIWSVTFQQSISASRWMAIGGIFLGCSINQVPKMMNDQFTPAIFWAVLLAFSNAAGAVANEYAMKQRAQLDINLQNCILYTMCGGFVFTGLAFFEPAFVGSSEAFFTGFVPECWQVIILQVFTGLAVSRILKYVEAVTKTIVAAIRGPGVIFFGAMLFHSTLGASEVLATLIVCLSCWFYLRQGPMVRARATQKEPKETDSLLHKTASMTTNLSASMETNLSASMARLEKLNV